VQLLRDALGFLTASPAQPGPCEVRLIFDGGVERGLLTALATLAWIALAAVLMARGFSGTETRTTPPSS
jgi:hypothetical protein